MAEETEIVPSDLERYVQYHGNTSFNEKPFNDVDALIMTQLSYIDWSGMGIDFPGDGTITIGEAVKALSEAAKANRGPEMERLLDLLAESERYKNMTLSNFVTHKKTINDQDVTDFEQLEQMSAVVITYVDENGETQNFVSYIGTNNTLEGWCEDFNMAYDTMTEAQRRSVEYLNQLMDRLEGNVVLGGHSKGGNDAVYAYLFCHESVRSRISKIYVYDAPGLTPGICYVDENGNVVQLDQEVYRQMLERLRGYCPYDSIIGQLLIEYEGYIFVDTDAAILADHSAFEWRIDPVTGEFILREQSEVSKFFNEAFDEWIMTLPEDQREIFMDVVWSWIYTIGTDTFDGVGEYFKNDPIQAIGSILSYVDNLPEDQKESFLKSLGYLTLLLVDNGLEKYYPGYGTVRGKLEQELRKRNITSWESLWDYIRQAPIENTLDLIQSLLSDWDTLVALTEMVAFTRYVVAPILSAVVMLLVSALKLVITYLPIIAAVVAVLVVCKLAIDFIREHWEEIKALAIQAVEFVQEKITEFVEAMKLAIRTGFNAALTALGLAVEEIAEKVYRFSEAVIDVVQSVGRLASQMLEDVLKFTNPLLYGIVRVICGVRQAMVTLDMPRLQEAVDDMERLATRVSNMDTRLRNLYRSLSQNNIEQGEGLFTSLANMYNLTRANVCVDQGGTIRRKATAISDLYAGYADTERWILQQLGG